MIASALKPDLHGLAGISTGAYPALRDFGPSTSPLRLRLGGLLAAWIEIMMDVKHISEAWGKHDSTPA